MFYKKRLFLLLFFVSLYSFAQQRPGGNFSPAEMNIGTIRGKLIDNQTGLPVEYGNVVLYRLRDSVMATGTITRPDGSFVLEKVMVGRYYAIAQFIGYAPKTISDIFINPRNPEVDLGEIRISPKISTLEGVEITAERDVMVANLDKRVINVEKDLTSIGGTAVDIMQNIPSVTVDVEGNVKLRGSSNVLILIDGKPTGMEGISSADLLQQIPANSIESVEVITNPSVRYDPDGTTGIINIVLKKRALEGMSGMVSLNAGTGNRYNGNLNLNYRGQKVSFSASFDGRLNRFSGSSETSRKTVFNEYVTYLNQTGSNQNRMLMGHGSMGVDYNPNRFHTITFQFRYRTFGGNSDNESLNTTTNNNNLILREFDRNSSSERVMQSFNYTLSYRKTSKLKGEELTADLILMDNNMRMDQQTDQKTVKPTVTNLRQDTRNRNANLMGIAQLNYIRPIGETSRIEGGFKSEVKTLKMKNTYTWFDPTTTTTPDDSTVNRFEYLEQVHAVYGIYAGQYEKFRYQAGLRLEQAMVQGSENSDSKGLDRSYFSAYPSLHLVYSIKPNRDIQLSYSRRISRPQNRNLNPYIDYSDSLNIRSGNPKLKPEYTGSWDLSFVTYQGRNSFTSSVFFRQTTDVVQFVSRLEGNGVTWTKPENLTSSQSYGVELILARELASWLRINANTSFFRQVIQGVPKFNIEPTDDFTWNARLNAQISTSKTSNLQLSGNYQAPTIMAQGKMGEMYFADIAWRGEFFNRKASFSVRLSDVFNSRKHNFEAWGPGFETKSLRKMDSRVLWFGVSYRINNYQRVRERNRNAMDEGVDMDEF